MTMLIPLHEFVWGLLFIAITVAIAWWSLRGERHD